MLIVVDVVLLLDTAPVVAEPLDLLPFTLALPDVALWILPFTTPTVLVLLTVVWWLVLWLTVAFELLPETSMLAVLACAMPALGARVAADEPLLLTERPVAVLAAFEALPVDAPPLDLLPLTLAAPLAAPWPFKFATPALLVLFNHV